MKKPGAHFKFNDETSLLLIILAIVVLFIAFIKPIYNFMGKVKSGSLFEKHKNSNVIEENKKLEDNYVMLTPTGADRTKCSKTVSDEGGDKTIDVVLYHTAGKLQSITAKYKYSGMTNDYSNYIFLAHSQMVIGLNGDDGASWGALVSKRPCCSYRPETAHGEAGR